MNNVYMSVSGNEVSILDRDSQQVMIFDNYGGFKREGLVSNLSSLIPASAISIISLGINYCEVFAEGMRKGFNINYLSACREIMKYKKLWQGIVFRIKHDENVPHVILVSHLEDISMSDVDKILKNGNSVWTKCN